MDQPAFRTADSGPASVAQPTLGTTHVPCRGGAAHIGSSDVESSLGPSGIRRSERCTYYGTLFDIGWPDAPHRTLRNATIDAWIAAGSPPSGQRPNEGEILATRPDGTEVVRYSSVSARATMTGRIDELSLWCGQGVGLVHEILPAAEIVRQTVDQAKEALARLGRSAVPV